jgi:hypothetical protein
MSHWQSVDQYFRRNDIVGAVAMLENFILERPAQRFSCLPGASFSNPHSAIIGELNRLIEASQKRFDVKAIYLEMNGFDINYDRWYFDLFAYSTYSPNVDDTEWLCDWHSDNWPQVELSGMASAQEAFAWYHDERVWRSQPEFKPVYEAAMLLVMAKFAAFVGSVLKSGRLVKAIPILATAHDFESVARYEH